MNQKTMHDLTLPENAEDVAKLASTIAAAAELIAADRNFDRPAAGVLTLRAAVGLLAADADSEAVARWLTAQAALLRGAHLVTRGNA